MPAAKPARGRTSPAAAPPASGRAALRGFHRNFWLINAIELVERGAYYGITAIFLLHFTAQGLSTAFIGLMGAVLVFFAYFFPVVAGALAEKYGFRRSMVVAFALAALGYVGLGSTGGLAALGDFAILPGVLLLGLGAGLFKPIAASVIAQTTTVAQRGFGFTVYYAGINVGGFLGPLLIGVLLPAQFFAFAFYAAAGFALLNVAILALVYRDQHRPQSEKTVAQAFAQLAEVRRDRWFLVLLVFYSGLWFMYAQQLYFAPLYFDDFVVGMPAWFTAPLVNTINPFVIILVGPFLGKALSKYPSLPVVIGGILVYVFGTLLVGFSPAATLFLAGITLASFGEVIAQPNFLSYVSKVAPAGKLALYMGYGFVPVGVGLVLGLAVGGVMYEAFAETMRQPALYWGLSAAVGAASLAGMLLVNRRMAARQPDVQALRGPAQRALSSRAAPLAMLALVPLLLLASVVPGVQPAQSTRLLVGPAETGGLDVVRLDAIEGRTDEGSASAQVVQVPDARAVNVTFTLRWEDEAPAGGPLPGVTNAPDRFQLAVTSPDGRTLEGEAAANAAGGEGVVALVVPNLAGRAADGAYRVEVRLLEAGDQVVGPGLAASQDTGNAWTLEPTFLVPS